MRPQPVSDLAAAVAESCFSTCSTPLKPQASFPKILESSGGENHHPAEVNSKHGPRQYGPNSHELFFAIGTKFPSESRLLKRQHSYPFDLEQK